MAAAKAAAGKDAVGAFFFFLFYLFLILLERVVDVFDFIGLFMLVLFTSFFFWSTSPNATRSGKKVTSQRLRMSPASWSARTGKEK